MPLDNVGNFARDSTTAAVDSTQTTIPVSDASVFPDPSVAEYNVVIWDATQYPRADQDPDAEIMRVTARDTVNNDLTVTRGQEGTTGASHPSGSGVINTFTAGFADDIASVDDTTTVTTLTPLEAVTAPTASGTNALAVGVDEVNSTTTSASGANSLAIGNGASADGEQTTVLGYSASANKWSLAIGRSSSASGEYAAALGGYADASGDDSAAVGSNSTASAQYSVAVGYSSNAPNAAEGVLGGDDQYGPNAWVVPGDFTVNGSKNFEISDPSRPETHDLRHGNYEGDVAGGLLYRREVSVTTDGDTGVATVTMPAWFAPLASDVDVWVQADQHFGDAYATVDGNTVEVTANADGDYKLLIVGTRDDENVPDPADYECTKPKGVNWDGEPRAYYRDAPGADPANYDGVERIEQFFDHTEECDPTPCPTAFEEWRVTLSDGERVDVQKPMDAAIQTVVDAAKEA